MTRHDEALRVEQRHREFAADLIAGIAGDSIPHWSAHRRILEGRADSHSFVQAFARFEGDHLTRPSTSDVEREAIEAAMPFMGVALEPDDIRGLVRAVLEATALSHKAVGDGGLRDA